MCLWVVVSVCVLIFLSCERCCWDINPAGYLPDLNPAVSQAVAAVLDHLTDEKRKHSHMLWVNLQEEPVFEGNGQVFTPREPSCLDQHIPIPASDTQLIEVVMRREGRCSPSKK